MLQNGGCQCDVKPRCGSPSRFPLTSYSGIERDAHPTVGVVCLHGYFTCTVGAMTVRQQRKQKLLAKQLKPKSNGY